MESVKMLETRWIVPLTAVSGEPLKWVECEITDAVSNVSRDKFVQMFGINKVVKVLSLTVH